AAAFALFARSGDRTDPTPPSAAGRSEFPPPAPRSPESAITPTGESLPTPASAEAVRIASPTPSANPAPVVKAAVPRQARHAARPAPSADEVAKKRSDPFAKRR